MPRLLVLCALVSWITLCALASEPDKVGTSRRSGAGGGIPLLGGESDFMCGPHCLWQVARVYGKDYSMNAVASMAGTDPYRGTTLDGMVKAAGEIGLSVEAKKTSVRALAGDPRVAILLLACGRGGHFVIPDNIEGKRVRLLDGKTFRDLTIDQLRSVWNGYAILIGDCEEAADGRYHLCIGRCLQSCGILVFLGLGGVGMGDVWRHLAKRPSQPGS